MSSARRHSATRALALLLPLLAVAACQTDKKPITGFDMQPPGSIVQVTDGNTESGGLVIWPVFAMDTQADVPVPAERPGSGLELRPG